MLRGLCGENNDEEFMPEQFEASHPASNLLRRLGLMCSVSLLNIFHSTKYSGPATAQCLYIVPHFNIAKYGENMNKLEN